MTRKEYNTCVDKTADSLYRFFVKLCRNKQDAQDIVQLSYERLWNNRDSVENTSVKAWLFTTARHLMIDMYRKRKREAKILDIKAYAQMSSRENSDIKDLLKQAFKTLKPEFKELILLRDYEGYTYKEIAGITGLSMSQVKVYIFRARKSLREWIKKTEKVEHHA